MAVFFAPHKSYTDSRSRITFAEPGRLGLPLDRFFGGMNFSKKKGVYPYDYMDNFKKFKENKLPSKEDFHSLLRDEDISDEEYQHAQEVWGAFRIENRGNTMIYISDVLPSSSV